MKRGRGDSTSGIRSDQGPKAIWASGLGYVLDTRGCWVEPSQWDTRPERTPTGRASGPAPWGSAMPSVSGPDGRWVLLGRPAAFARVPSWRAPGLGPSARHARPPCSPRLASPSHSRPARCSRYHRPVVLLSQAPPGPRSAEHASSSPAEEKDPQAVRRPLL